MTGGSSAPRSAKPPIKVALVGNGPKFLEHWTRRINCFPDFACICSCATGENALQTIPGKRPDVVLLDIILPGISGARCIIRLKELLPQVRIVIFTARAEPASVVRALSAGADGYLLKHTKPEELRIALLAALNDGAPMTSQIARRVVESFRRQMRVEDESRRLSFRQEWILRLLCRGYTSSLVAEKLGLSVNTVSGHLKSVFKKLQVASRTEAVVCYLASKIPRQHSLPPHELPRDLARNVMAPSRRPAVGNS